MAYEFQFSDDLLNIVMTGNFTFVYAVKLEFKNETLRLHTGTGEIVIDGETYRGVGTFGKVGTAQESSSDSSNSVDLTLSGFDSSLITDATIDGCKGRAGKLMLVVFDENGNYAADILTSGIMDRAEFSYGGDNDNSITIPLKDRMFNWDSLGDDKWTDESHQRKHPGDRFFTYIAQVASFPIWWGSSKDAPSFTYK